MGPGPLVVMTREAGARGWTVRVDALAVRVNDTVIAARRDGRLQVLRDGSQGSEATLGEPFWVGELEVVCFRSEEARGAPTPPVMKAIKAVRADDTDDARRVLADVLEESGALAEAEYVRLELQLQSARRPGGKAFVEGVKQLRVLSGVVGPTFRYLVGRDIDGCVGVRWSFRCPASWEAMKKTSNETERVCMSCRQLVVQVDSEAGAEALARKGVCVQVRVDAPDDDWVGEVAHPDLGWVGLVEEPPPEAPEEDLVPEPAAPRKGPSRVGSVAVRPQGPRQPPAPSQPASGVRPVPAKPRRS